MKKFFTLLAFVTLFAIMAINTATAQYNFDVKIDTTWLPTEVVMPPSPLRFQVLFIGDTDIVETTATYGTHLVKLWQNKTMIL